MSFRITIWIAMIVMIAMMSEAGAREVIYLDGIREQMRNASIDASVKFAQDYPSGFVTIDTETLDLVELGKNLPTVINFSDASVVASAIDDMTLGWHTWIGFATELAPDKVVGTRPVWANYTVTDKVLVSTSYIAWVIPVETYEYRTRVVSNKIGNDNYIIGKPMGRIVAFTDEGPVFREVFTNGTVKWTKAIPVGIKTIIFFQ